MKINIKLLNYLYIVIPAMLLFIFIDSFYLDNFFQKTIPKDPKKILIYNLFLNLPHILWSFLIFKKRNLQTRYKEFPISSLLFFLIMPSTIFFIDYNFFVLALLYTTLIHVFFQQFRLLNSYLEFNKLSKFLFPILYILILTFSIIRVDDIIPISTEYLQYLNIDYLYLISFFGFLLLSILNVSNIKRESLSIKLHFLGVFAIPLFATLFFYWQYSLLGIFIIRFIHDATAIYYYYNYEREILKTKKTSIILNSIIPILAVNTIILFSPYYMYIAAQLGFFHYFIESFIWKRKFL